MARLRTIIVGGGLGGLSLAHALVAKGFSVAVFERDSGPDGRGQGYRMTIDEIGSNALRACLPSRNYDFIRATAGAAGKAAAFIFLDERARELHRLSFDLEAGERRGQITGQVDRTTLRQALLSGLDDRVHFAKTLTGYKEGPNQVIARFSDGSSAEGDILIGADGANSRVRQQLMPEAEPIDTGIRGIFGRTPVARVDLSTLGGLLTNSGIMALGPRGLVFFCTAMRFREPPAIAAARLGIEGNIWPSEDYFMWAVAVRQHGGPKMEVDTAEELHEIARRAVLDYHDDYQRLVLEADPGSTVLVPIRVAPRFGPSPAHRVTLVGDAIHVMPPFGAHGANTAFKDAQILAGELSNGADPLSVDEAIGAYESKMRQYSRQVIKSALRMMTLATADLPFKRAILRAVLRAAGAFSR